MKTEFEQNKDTSTYLLGNASVDYKPVHPNEAHSVYLLAQHLRAELYEGSNGRATIDINIVNEFDKAIQRLFA